MPKHKTRNPQLQELYDTVQDLEGIQPIDGRSSDICYVANVTVLQRIVDRLTETYGPPTQDHPLLDDIEWRVRKNFRIVVNKACDLKREGTLHHLYALSF